MSFSLAQSANSAPQALPGLIRRRHWWWLLLLVWTALSGLSLNHQIDSIRQQGLALSQASARNVFNLVVLARKWNANHGGVYVPVTEKFQPNPYLKVPWRDLLTTQGQQLTLVNPAFMTRLIGELAEKSDNLKLHITSLNPLRPGNAADSREHAVLRAFEQGEKERAWLERTQDGGTLFRYMGPLRVEPPCLTCHAAQGYKLGDVRGGISVSFDYDLAAENGRIQQMTLLHLLIFLLVAGLGWWLLEQLRWRWLRLDQEMVNMRSAMDHVLRDEKMASLGRMVAGFAHEINTPIGVALGAISHSEHTLDKIDRLIASEEVSEEELRQELGYLRSGEVMAASNLARAVNLIKSFKRTAVDQSSEMQRVYDMKELIDDVVHMLQNHIKRLPIELVTTCPEHLLIDGIPGQIQQLLTNLIMNSIIHGFEDGQRSGEIRIEVGQPAPGRIAIEFSDTGVGMAESVRARIFESFFTTRRDSGGSGLGLFICHDIVVNKLHGSITCDSAPGAGTCFHIEFDVRLHTEANH